MEKGYSQRSDEELVRLAQAGRETPAGRAAATELLGRYRRAVYVWCYRYAGEHEQALDLSQDVLVRAWESLESFRGRSKFSSWLFAIARNRCLNSMRGVELFEDDEGAIARVADTRPPPGRELEERLDERRLIDLIRSSLDPVEQSVLWMRCFERVPVDQITAVLKIDTASGARGILQRARRKLRAAMKEQEPNEE
jgi:RNA polymerase sigma-70 factor (ECF subfamily)